MNKKLALISGIVIAALIGGAMFFKDKQSQPVAQAAQEKVQVKHALGTTDVAVNPKKVIVFDYAILDAMEALGVEGVVGVPQSSSIPEYLSKFKGEAYGNVGGVKEPDLEKINALAPDLIIINGRQHSFYDKFSEIAPTISMSKKDGKYMESFTYNMEVLGDIFSKQKEVETELAKINEKIKGIHEAVTAKGYKATTLMVSDGNLSVFGAESRFGLIYNNLGFKNTDDNIEASLHGQNVSFEYVASQDSDYIFVVDKSVISKDKGQKPAQEILNNDLMNNSKAVKEGNIIYLDTHSWYLSDGGFISTNTMLDEVNQAISK